MMKLVLMVCVVLAVTNLVELTTVSWATLGFIALGAGLIKAGALAVEESLANYAHRKKIEQMFSDKD